MCLAKSPKIPESKPAAPPPPPPEQHAETFEETNDRSYANLNRGRSKFRIDRKGAIKAK